MSRNRTSLMSTLLAVSALGATAGMLAWRWSQRHRAQRVSFHRELSRWEGEGGALAQNGSAAPEMAVSLAEGGAEAGPGMTEPHAARGTANGAAGTPWPFPHGNA
jgi:hypothetical protein